MELFNLSSNRIPLKCACYFSVVESTIPFNLFRFLIVNDLISLIRIVHSVYLVWPTYRQRAVYVPLLYRKPAIAEKTTIYSRYKVRLTIALGPLLRWTRFYFPVAELERNMRELSSIRLKSSKLLSQANFYIPRN